MNIKIVFLVLGILIVACPYDAFGQGACCFSDNSCSIAGNPTLCSDAGGAWNGNPSCVPNPCPGACCTPLEPFCFHANDEFDCTEGGIETWMGHGTTCASNPCQEPEGIPTMTQWGLIIFAVLISLGAMYYMRRQRRKSS